MIVPVVSLLVSLLLCVCTDGAYSPEQGYAQLFEDELAGSDMAETDDFDIGQALDSDNDLDIFYPNSPVETGTDMSGGAVSKRPFCNGFMGCGRTHGKRSSSSILMNKLRLSDSVHEAPINAVVSPVAKRPFCNGFFGCGNPGKRIVIRRTYQTGRRDMPLLEKRYWCNPSVFGCFRDGKRVADSQWMQSMRTLLNQKA